MEDRAFRQGHDDPKPKRLTERDDLLRGTRLQSGQEQGVLETLGRAEVVEAVDYGLAAGRSVRSLLHAMAEVGCPVDRSFFHVVRCSAAVGGGFAPEHGVILCHNRLHTRREVLNAMTHELIHAYDHCRYGGRIGGDAEPGLTEGSAAMAATGAAGDGRRGTSGDGSSTVGSSPVAMVGGTGSDGPTARIDSSRLGCSSEACSSEGGGMASGGGDGSSGSGGGSAAARPGGLDWSNCRHHACTEIRAANLSGDCSLLQELLRGNLPLLPLGWRDQQRACVARRAALSVAMNPACGGQEEAAAVVSEMLPACLADTAPFDASEAVAAPP